MPDRVAGKNNPNVALTEAVAVEQWQSGMGPDYVPFVSKDIYGRNIDEPDLSNPTRSRYERPLDTIRSFEAAAYGKDFASGGSDIGADTPRNASRLSVNGFPGGPSRRESMQHSNSGYSQRQSLSGAQYAYGVPQGEYDETPGASHWDARHGQGGPVGNPYGSPVSDTGRAPVQQMRLPAQKLNYQTPPTPPQDNAAAGNKSKEKKSLFKKRLSFGKSKQ